MADKPKEKSKSKSSSSSGEGGGGSNAFVDIVFWMLLAMVAYSVVKGMLSAMGFSFGWPSTAGFFEFVFDKVQIYSIFLSLVFFIGIIYFNFKIGEIATESHHRIHGHHGAHSAHHSAAHTTRFQSPKPKPFENKHTSERRWEMVMTRVNSFSEGDWRLAVLEADIILADMLSKMGLPGNGVAEKLKVAPKDSFRTLDDAWTAHKYRNRIAHEGGSFHLSQEEAKQAIGLYKKVFDEFYFI